MLNGMDFYGMPFLSPASVPDSGKSLIITTLSPLLVVNSNGHPEARFPKSELAGFLGLNDSELTLSVSHTRTEVIGGYHAHLALPRQQWPAIGPGSVFVFELKDNPSQEVREKLAELEIDGLGVRRGEGYGRIAVNRQNNLNLSYNPENQLDDLTKAPGPNVPDLEISKDLLELLKGVVRTRCLAEIQEKARAVARKCREHSKQLTTREVASIPPSRSCRCR